jgi:T5SS/PEP-CTERM-associated repeat protein
MPSHRLQQLEFAGIAMRYHRVWLAAIAFAFVCAGTVQANTTWTGAGDGIRWDDPANWSNGLPAIGSGTGNRTLINGVGTTILIDSATTATSGRLLLADDAGSTNITINMTGGTLTTNNTGTAGERNWHLGEQGLATFNMTGGTVNATGEIRLGTDPVATSQGILSVNGGAFNATGQITLGYGAVSTLTQQVSLASGSISSVGLSVGDKVGTVGEVTVSGGTMTVGGTTRLGNSGQGTLTVSGGTFNATGPIIMAAGSADGVVQNLNLSGGTLNATRFFVDDNVASGTPAAIVTMTGGAMNVGDLAIPTNYGLNGLNGHFQLDGGFVTVNNASLDVGNLQNQPSGFRLANGLGDGGNASNFVTGTMDITAGALLLSGDVSALVQSYIDGGFLTGSGNPLNILYDYNVTNPGFTTVHTSLNTGSLTTVWTGGGDGLNWNVAGNWSIGTPTSAAIAAINGAATTAQVATGVVAEAKGLSLASGAADNVVLNVNGGGTLNLGSALSVGVAGHGTLNVAAGSAVTGSGLTVGDQSTSVGQVAVSGGTMTDSGATTLGNTSGSSGQITVSGGTLGLGATTVGNGGAGILNLTGGTTAVSGKIVLGADSASADAKGTVTINGGSLSATGDFLMAGSFMTTEVQTLNMMSGSLTASRLLVNDNAPGVVPGAVPMAVVNMTGGTIAVTDLSVPSNYSVNGLNGHFQLDGGAVTVNRASVGGLQNTPLGFRLANGFGDGDNAANSVTGTMDITGGTLKLAGGAVELIMGYRDAGVLTGFGNSANIVFDYNATNPGFTTVHAVMGGGGPVDTTWTGGGGNSNWQVAGNWDSGAPATVTKAHINGSAVAQVAAAVNATAARLSLADGASTDNTTLNANGGVLTVGGNALIGTLGHGTLNVTAGSQVLVGGDVQLGVNNGEVNAQGSVSVAGGTLAAGGAIRLGVGDSTSLLQQLTVSGASSVTAAGLTIGEQAASMAQTNLSGGTLAISGATNLSNGQSTLAITGGKMTSGSLAIAGQAGSIAQMNVSGGTTTVSGLARLGASGQGTMQITGGAVTLGNNLVLGADALATNAKGTLTVDGGSLNVAGTISMGGTIFTSEVQTLNMTSGFLSASRLLVDNATPSFGGPMAVVNMTGGGMVVRDLAVPSNWAVNGLNGHVDLDGGVVLVSNASTGVTTANAEGFRLANGLDPEVGGINTVTGTMDITNGTLLLSGDATTLVQTYIDNGVLTGNGVPSGVLYDYDTSNPGYTTVYTSTGVASLTSNWTGGGDGLNWQIGANWDNGASSPSSPRFANISGSPTVQVAAGVNASALSLTLANGAGTDNVTLNANGGTLTIGGDLSAGTIGHATLNVTNSSNVSVGGTATIGDETGSVGQVTISGGTMTVNERVVIGNNGQGSLTVNGGALNVTTTIIMAAGNPAGVVQTLNLSSGSLTASRLLVADNVASATPSSIVTMTGGAMSVGDLAIPTNYGLDGLNGLFQLKGGTVTVTNPSTGGKQNQPSGFRLANGAGEGDNAGNTVTGLMDITSGTLKLTGDALAVINPYITTDHSLLAYGGTGIVLRDTTTNPGFTTVTASILGDANRDGHVDIFDINLISANWNTAGPTADVNGDSAVDIFDINAVSAHWAQTNPDGPTAGLAAASAVPEPASVIGLAIGALLLAVRFRGKLRVQ